MTDPKGIEVTVKDLETGVSNRVVIWDDYIVVTAGSCHVSHTQAFPKSGTHILTIKGRKA